MVPPKGNPATIAPSLGGQKVKKGVGTSDKSSGVTNGHTNGVSHNVPYPYDTEAEPGNPTVVPEAILKLFHFTFLIRHPRHSIPSYWRCTIPPLDSVTGFYDFMPSEAGYDELRRVFDFLKAKKQVGPTVAGEHGVLDPGEVSITVIDADDLLDDPDGIISAYCKEVGIDYSPQMLNWDTEKDHQRAKDAFEKWKGFHDDAINSTSLKPRSAAHVSLFLASPDRHHLEHLLTQECKKKKAKTVEVENNEWIEKYGENAARIIRETVDANIADYEYLKSFAIKL